jgi:hypothetical protein
MGSINLWHNDLWTISFSNIPSVTTITDLDIFNQFVKSVNFPEYSGENENTDQFIGFRAEHPIGHSLNREVGMLQVEFKIDEQFKNYIHLFTWMQNIRYGQNIDTELLRDYVCKEISLTILDNLKRTQGRFSFTKATCIGLSAIPMAYGTGEEVTFMANFDYEQVLWNPENIPTCEK